MVNYSITIFRLLNYLLNHLFSYLGCALGMYYLATDALQLHEENNRMVCRLLVSRQLLSVLSIASFTIQTGMPLVVMTVTYSLIVYQLNSSGERELFQNDAREMETRGRQNKKTMK